MPSSQLGSGTSFEGPGTTQGQAIKVPQTTFVTGCAKLAEDLCALATAMTGKRVCRACKFRRRLGISKSPDMHEIGVAAVYECRCGFASGTAVGFQRHIARYKGDLPDEARFSSSATSVSRLHRVQMSVRRGDRQASHGQ